MDMADLTHLTPMQRHRLAAALWAAELGWHVFPLHPGTKHPAIRAWEQRATTDRDQITAFWSAHPDHNTAIACGPSGLVVVDLDQARPDQPAPEGLSMRGITSGAQVLALLAHQVGANVPATHTVATPSGGTHLYYRTPSTTSGTGAGTGLRNTAGTIGWLIDTRAAGGYVVAPGSVTPNGAYELIDDRFPVELPAWMVQAHAPKPPPASTAPIEVPSERVSGYVAAAVQAQAERVRTAPPGAHNKTLFVAACRLGELVGAGALDHIDAHLMLKQSAAPILASGCECTEREIEATIDSGLRTGARRPRTNLPCHPGRAA